MSPRIGFLLGTRPGRHSVLPAVVSCLRDRGAEIADKLASPFSPDPDDRAIALAAGGALGLEVYGVDLIRSERGPVVVDVNALPGFEGVPKAEHSLADYLLQAARAREEASACAS